MPVHFSILLHIGIDKQWNVLFHCRFFIKNENDITSYWNNNLPIIMSVDGEYSYYAINIESGNVVIGYEPEYEDSSVVAEDFNTFINRVVSGEIEL